MEQAVARTLLVIGDNHKELADKYSADITVDKWLKFKHDDAAKMHQGHLEYVRAVVGDTRLPLTKQQKSLYRLIIGRLEEMTDEQYFRAVTRGLEHDDNGDAYTTENPEAKYWTPRCYQGRLEKTGEEGYFSNPFILKETGENGQAKRSYVAKFDEIDWAKMHLNNVELYRAAWELVVDGRAPKNEQEKQIADRMANRRAYFMNFIGVEDYIIHSTAFWTYAIINANGFASMDDSPSDREWVRTFFDNFIKPLEGTNPTLAIYEVRILDDKDISQLLFEEDTVSAEAEKLE